jgi:hypothetical protein
VTVKAKKPTKKRRVFPRRWYILQPIARNLMKAIPGKDGVIVPDLDADDLHALGKALYEISRGEDAREVFEQQADKGNTNLTRINIQRATRYWFYRVKNHSDIDGAIKAAQECFPDPPTPATIKRIASKHRELALKNIEAWSYWKDENSKNHSLRKGPDTTELRKYLEKKGPHFKD